MGDRSFQKTFVAADPTALRLLPRDYRSAASRLAHVKAARSRPVSDALMAELTRQQAALPSSECRQRNLRLLREGAAVIATGQQVGLLLGPLYTFYKAATAIAWARRLEEETKMPCVPLFWLQAEDHDFEEINHCHIPKPGGDSLTITLTGEEEAKPQTTAAMRISVAHRRLGPAVSEVHAQLRDVLDGLPHATEVLAEIAAAYQAGSGWVEAFAHWLARLFADEGLLVMNPRTEAVATLSVPLFELAMRRHAELSAALLARNAELREAGFEPQVHVRPDSPLPFFHPRGALGPRFRLRQKHGQERWHLIGDETGGGDIGADVPYIALQKDPMTMSSSALLRPLLQDWLLPVAGYVAGPSELAYYAQLEPAYQLLGISPGLVLPRAHFRLVEPRIEELRSALGLTAADLELPEEAILSLVAERATGDRPTPQVLRERLLAPFEQEIDRLGDSLGATGIHLESSLSKTRDRVTTAIGKLAQRYQRATLERDQVTTHRLERVLGALMPLGKPQERYYSLPYFVARYGLEHVKHSVLSALDPLSTEVREIHLG